MDYRQLRYFIAVAEELSFSRAAKRLHVSQPPLSTQIKAMEEELGTQLLSRTRRAVELTQAGQLLLEHARRAVSELDLASETVRRAARGEAGARSVSVSPTRFRCSTCSPNCSAASAAAIRG
ncbi:DNA-binding transcriptional LysR family regulator [Bradyrhizobium sp. JR6.1]